MLNISTRLTINAENGTLLQINKNIFINLPNQKQYFYMKLIKCQWTGEEKTSLIIYNERIKYLQAIKIAKRGEMQIDLRNNSNFENSAKNFGK